LHKMWYEKWEGCKVLCELWSIIANCGEGLRTDGYLAS
jgi:hypothetical protein